MLTKDQLKCAIVMIGRADMKGNEAAIVASTLEALIAEYNRQLPPESEDDDPPTD